MTTIHAPLSRAAVRELVQAAVAAPSMHNVQPWRFRVHADSERIDLFADPQRSLPASDPAGRALMLGCGAALLNLRVAVRHAGREPVIRLFPHAALPSLMATVRLAGSRRPGQDDEALYRAIWNRRTNRGPFADVALPRRTREDMADAARAEGAELLFLPEGETQRVLGLVAEADRLATLDPDRRTELARWTTTVHPEAPPADGVPSSAFGPTVAHATLPLRDFDVTHSVAGRPEAEFEQRPQVAVLLTRFDDRTNWLRAGQALQRVLLVATSHGVAASFLNQALEWAEMRWLVLPSNAGIGHVHMLIRLGFGDQVEPTPRRPVDEILELARD